MGPLPAEFCQAARGGSFFRIAARINEMMTPPITPEIIPVTNIPMGVNRKFLYNPIIISIWSPFIPESSSARMVVSVIAINVESSIKARYTAFKAEWIALAMILIRIPITAAVPKVMELLFRLRYFLKQTTSNTIVITRDSRPMPKLA